MKTLFASLVLALALVTGSCGPNVYQPAGAGAGAFRSVEGDLVQVKAEEYDTYFERRYGLLYRAFAQEPFTGRVQTVEVANGRSFVALDESWKNGKRHGKSTRWFTNGQKSFERDYHDGKWHGLVTRWWPNGQKMYVRAYTDGERHGKELTWRSDGTQIDLSAPVLPATPEAPPAPVAIPEGVETTEIPGLPEASSGDSFGGPEETPSTPDSSIGSDTVEPAFPPIDSGTDLPGLPGDATTPDLPPPPADSGSPVFPPIGGGTDLPAPPPAPPGGDLPGLPPAPAGSGLPPPPPLPSDGTLPGLPPLTTP